LVLEKLSGLFLSTLEATQLRELFINIEKHFDLSELKEFTVEAGRPDTITTCKLKALNEAGVSRICINPQSMQDKTLKLIGRSHTPQDIKEAFLAARETGPAIINMDIIAGLPDESTEDFLDTIREVLKLRPENITVHTLAVKRASKLIDMNKDYHYEQGETAREMLRECKELLEGEGYIPYYLYRQKRMAGNLENIGWCKRGTAGIYNIRIMEEKQTIIAFGAGGVTKVYYPGENRLERVPNVTNYELYTSRIDEMIQRKEGNIC
jgi:oxygen-independent coproporphyrinogen-3 oxidase